MKEGLYIIIWLNKFISKNEATELLVAFFIKKIPQQIARWGSGLKRAIAGALFSDGGR